MPKVTVIGTTSWGVTLADLLSRNGNQVKIWARTEREAANLELNGLSFANGKTFQLAENVVVTASLKDAMTDTKAVFLVVPAQTMRTNVRMVAAYLKRWMLVVSAAKGIEMGSNKLMSQVLEEEIPPDMKSKICVLSGPNLAREVIEKLPASAVVAAEKEAIARRVRQLISAPGFTVYTNTDVIGVELGGALKNIIALWAGMADGLGFGDNAKAAFITRGLTEITALGVAMGANPLTFSGLAGLGDLIATCASPLSRNHYVGEELAKGRSLTEIVDGMDNVAEGVPTTSAALELAEKFGLEMPLTEKIYRVLYRGLSPQEAAREMIDAEVAHELTGRKWNLFSLFRRKKPA